MQEIPYFCRKIRNDMDILVREAGLEDIPVIREMASETFPATYREIITGEQIAYMMEWMYSEESLTAQISRDGHVYLVAFADGLPAGYVSFTREDAGLFHLQKIYVLPSMQGLHIGTRLFDEAMGRIRLSAGGPCRVELNVNRYNKALDFYRRMGMRILRQGDFEIGQGFYMNDYIMGLDI